jgi:hypothetical protein
VPETIQALVIAVLCFLPGALYIWAFEREVGRWGIGLADRVFRFLGVSALLLAAYAFPGFVIWSRIVHHRVSRNGRVLFENRLTNGLPLPWWLFLLPVAYVFLPLMIGFLAAWATRSRNRYVKLVARFVVGRDPAPRAWDDLFFERPNGAVRIRLKDFGTGGQWIGGLFAEKSYAAGYPEQPQDLYLERAYPMNQDDGSFIAGPHDGYQELGSGVLVRWDEIRYLEFFHGKGEGG